METKNVCACCGLPLGEEYTVYKGIKMHPTCYMVYDKKVEPSWYAEELKKVSALMDEKGDVSLDEVCELLETCNHGAVSTLRNRARNILHRMRDMGAIEETKAERSVVRSVKVWKKIEGDSKK